MHFTGKFCCFDKRTMNMNMYIFSSSIISYVEIAFSMSSELIIRMKIVVIT